MVNQVVIVGRLTRDIELRATTTGREVANFSVAVNRNYKNAQGEYDADFINCVAYGQTARFASSYLGKGRLVSIVGRIQTRTYDNPQGQRVYITEVIADNVSGLDRRPENQQQGNSYNTGYNQPKSSPQDFMDNPPMNNNNVNAPVNNYPLNDIDDDDLPF